MSKRVAVEVQIWTKRYTSAFDGLSEARLEVFPLRGGSRLTSSVRYLGKPTAEQKRSRSSRPKKPDVWTERGDAVKQRIAKLAADGFTCAVKRVRVPEHEAPRGRSEGEIAREQYDRELHELIRR